jgi:hypothetical protein
MAYYNGELLKQNLGKMLNEFEELNVPISEVAIKIGQAIKKTPTADVVEVVRCKDCKYQDECLQKVDCEYLNREIFYCSYGERRTDDVR